MSIHKLSQFRKIHNEVGLERQNKVSFVRESLNDFFSTMEVLTETLEPEMIIEIARFAIDQIEKELDE